MDERTNERANAGINVTTMGHQWNVCSSQTVQVFAFQNTRDKKEWSLQNFFNERLKKIVDNFFATILVSF